MPRASNFSFTWGGARTKVGAEGERGQEEEFQRYCHFQGWVSNPSLTVRKRSGLPGQWVLMNPASDGTWVRGRQPQAAHLLQAGCQQSLPSQMCVFRTASHLPCCHHMPMAPGHSPSVPPWPPSIMTGRSSSVTPVSSLSAGTPSSSISMLPSPPSHFHLPKTTPDSLWEILHHAAQLNHSKRPPVPKLIVKEKSEQLLWH